MSAFVIGIVCGSLIFMTEIPRGPMFLRRSHSLRASLRARRQLSTASKDPGTRQHLTGVCRAIRATRQLLQRQGVTPSATATAAPAVNPVASAASSATNEADLVVSQLFNVTHQIKATAPGVFAKALKLVPEIRHPTVCRATMSLSLWVWWR
eukprot:SAG25_NODE_980_length_4429_cov_1.828176_2_plen_152_part_00